MAAKIIFLLALLLLPSISQSQNIKPAFSVELRTDKLNYAFGEDVTPTLIIKNISGRRDSLSANQLEDVKTANNLQIFQNSKPIGCVQIFSHFVGPQFKILEPDEEVQFEMELNHFCGKISPGQYVYYNILDTGFYNCYTYLRVEKDNKGTFIVHKIKSDEIFFRVHPPDSNEFEKFEKLKKILNFSLEQKKDTGYMISVLEKLDEFIRKNINSNFSDIAFGISIFQVGSNNIYIDKEEELAEYYITSKPNGSHISNALYLIYNNELARTGNKERAKTIIEEYKLQHPNTRVEIEAKKLIERK